MNATKALRPKGSQRLPQGSVVCGLLEFFHLATRPTGRQALREMQFKHTLTSVTQSTMVNLKSKFPSQQRNRLPVISVFV
jgi:hypothetical protein